MTASRQQCAQATMFLTIYKEAVETLKQSAANNVDWKNYFAFRDQFISIKEKYSEDKLRAILASTDYKMKVQRIGVETLKNIQYMRFNYYVFLKYLPEYQNFKGGPRDLISILKKGTESLRNELQNAKSLQ